MTTTFQKPTAQASLIGATLGEYEVVGLIGRGAMGAVYLARDVALGRPVALKVLLGSLARNPSLVRSLHREARAAAPLRHPGIVRIYSAGVEAGTPYVAMEYVEGEPLDRFLRRKGRLTWQTALYIGFQVADALECAHRRGIVHRDVKPANVLLDREGRVRLADFGIANVQADESDIPGESVFLGTPDYMSPEQCAGREIGFASDLFSLGVTLYQMIAGELPFHGNSPMALIKSITTDECPRLNRVDPGVPDDVARLVAYLLQKRPDDRPPSAQAVCQTIARLQAEQGGRSAMPAALAAFIREQTQVRTVQVVAPYNKQGRRRGRKRSGRGFQLKRLRCSRRAALKAVMVAAAIVCAAAGVWKVAFLRAPPKQDPAPLIEDFIFEAVEPGILLARLPADGFQFRDVSWVGDRPVALVCVEGRPGRLTHGAHGVLAVELEARRALSVRPPMCPATDPDFWRVVVPVGGHHAVPPVPSDSPLRDTILFQVGRGRARDGTGRFVVTVGQKWNEAAPRPAALHQTTLGVWSPQPALPWHGLNTGHAIMKPDGFTLCLVLYDPAGESNYLGERDVRWTSLARMGPRLTTWGGTILPQSVQYAPDGASIAYIRETGRALRELWVLASGGREVNGRLLDVAALGDWCAFSPDGRAVVTWVSTQTGRPEVRLYTITGEAQTARLGPGRPGREPWHPSGEFLVVTAPGRGEFSRGSDSAPSQLWAVQAQPPHRRTQLTRLAEGVREGCAVSRDGRWVVAVTDGAYEPTLVFVDLNVVAAKTFR